MCEKIDILRINNEIINKINSRYDKKEELECNLEKLKAIKRKNDKKPNDDIRVSKLMNDEILKLENKIKSIEDKEELNFYLSDTIELINEYEKILKVPQKVSFMGAPVKNEQDKIKTDIVKRFLKIVSKYVEDDDDVKMEGDKNFFCEICGSMTFDNVNEVTFSCSKCFTEKKIMKQSPSYKDIDRVNICSKYQYHRRIHFRDCINQYQGKQNSSIPQKVYDELNKQFISHFLLNGDENTPKKERYSRITKDTIMIFLKDLDFSKQYENINLIYYNMTGKKPDDISQLEEKLMYDFDLLSELYDEIFVKNIERSNFINNQYVLYQLLKRHKHPCKKSDFSFLKTIDRIAFHDEVCTILFQHLGWNHYGYF